MNVAIRPATWDDRAAILALIATMGGHEDLLARPDPMRELGALLRNPNARALVAWSDRVVGVLFVQARSSITSGERIAWLGGVAVEVGLRGHGIGAALLAAAGEAAQLLGCATIALQSSARRVEAHAFYRKNGYAEGSPAARFSRPVPVPSANDASLVARFLACAARAASAVDAAIVDLGGAASVGMGADGAATEAADRAAETAAVAALRGLALPIVSEEAGVIGKDPHGEDLWISLDPLDGSRNFRAGLPPYGIAIGLVRGGVALAGFVCDLSSGRRWWAGDDGLAYADGRVVRAKRGELIGMPSPPGTNDLVRPGHIRHRVRVSGSCAIDLCRVADGSLSAFVALARPVVHAHDLAGPSAILRAAGASVRDHTGAVPRIVADPSQAYRLVAAADDELAERLATGRA